MFGTFYVPNITPDPKFGIGGWSDEDFIKAMTEGVSPAGKHYYPAFPYASYRHMLFMMDMADKENIEGSPEPKDILYTALITAGLDTIVKDFLKDLLSGKLKGLDKNE